MREITNNDAWSYIFDSLNILERIDSCNYFDITANEIKRLTGKEPRLMTKIDFKEHLPQIMRLNNLCILAIQNGNYRIAKNNPFLNIEPEPSNLHFINPPTHILSIDPYNIKSESAALDIAYISNMQNIVFGEKNELVIRGRLRGDLKFSLNNIDYNVDGVQIEVDSGYESDKSLYLIEAKIGYRNNINIRQLLYPQVYWEKQISKRKEVKSFLFLLQDSIYRFIPYIYEGNDIGYLDHLNEISFQFKDPIQSNTFFSIYNIEVDLNDANINNKIPFPQADKFEKINAILLFINSNQDTNRFILFQNFDLVERQIDYYCNAIKWLKLCEEKDDILFLTQKGKNIIKLPFKEKMIEIAKILFSNKIVHALLHNKENEIKNEWLIEYNINSDSTKNRRFATIKAWIQYFKDIFEEERV